MASDGLADSCDDDDHELETVHALAADDVREPAEEELADEGTDGGRDLEA